MIPPPEQLATLFVNFIAAPKLAEEFKAELQPPKPKLKKKPQARQLVAETPVLAENEPVAPLPPQEPETAAVVLPAPMPQGPITLSSELSGRLSWA
ncbi:MAG: hypothetical protein IPG31_04370 [Nitrosomonas sp.]|nr:hypothetical protein [Nitrosomonas sp.]